MYGACALTPPICCESLRAGLFLAAGGDEVRHDQPMSQPLSPCAPATDRLCRAQAVTGQDGEAQQRHPQSALQEEVAVPCEDMVQPARQEAATTHRCVRGARSPPPPLCGRTPAPAVLVEQRETLL